MVMEGAMTRTRLCKPRDDVHCVVTPPPPKGESWLTAGWGLSPVSSKPSFFARLAHQGPTRECIGLIIVYEHFVTAS